MKESSRSHINIKGLEGQKEGSNAGVPAISFVVTPTSRFYAWNKAKKKGPSEVNPEATDANA